MVATQNATGKGHRHAYVVDSAGRLCQVHGRDVRPPVRRLQDFCATVLCPAGGEALGEDYWTFSGWYFVRNLASSVSGAPATPVVVCDESWVLAESNWVTPRPERARLFPHTFRPAAAPSPHPCWQRLRSCELWGWGAGLSPRRPQARR